MDYKELSEIKIFCIEIVLLIPKLMFIGSHPPVYLKLHTHKLSTKKLYKGYLLYNDKRSL